MALSSKGNLDEAIAEFRDAIRINPNDASAHHFLGIALSKKAEVDQLLYYDAMLEFREAIRLKPDYAFPHFGLGNALAARKLLDDAVAEY
jgi:Flp pilus assembly protein TadD